MDRRTIKLLGALTASVAIVMAAALFLGGGASDPALRGSDATSLAGRQAGSGEDVVSPLGVRAATIDPARPGPAAPPVVASRGAMVAAVENPAASVETRARPSVEPAPPQAPIVPDAAAVAAGEAYAAAMPAVKQQVQAAIDRQKAAIRKACWTGEVPASASFPVEVSFDAEGNQLARSIGDNRGAPGIAPCVRQQPLRLDIDAPGLPITVQATIDLP